MAYVNSQIIDDNDVIIADSLATDYRSALSPTKWTHGYRTTAEQEINEGLGIENTIVSASAALWRRFDISSEMRATLKTLRMAGDWCCLVHAIQNGVVHYTATKLNHHRLPLDRRHIGLETASSRGFLEQRWPACATTSWHPTTGSTRISQTSGNGTSANDGEIRPESPFEHLAEFYPINRVRERIAVASGTIGSPSP